MKYKEVDVVVGPRERVNEGGDELWGMEEILVSKEVDRNILLVRNNLYNY